MKVSCYCCGEEIPDREPFFLVSFGNHHDASNRVMIFSEQHVDFADESNARVLVIRPLPPSAPPEVGMDHLEAYTAINGR